MNSLLFLKTLSTRTAKIFLGIHHTQSFLKRKDNNKKKKKYLIIVNPLVVDDTAPVCLVSISFLYGCRPFLFLCVPFLSNTKKCPAGRRRSSAVRTVWWTRIAAHQCPPSPKCCDGNVPLVPPSCCISFFWSSFFFLSYFETRAPLLAVFGTTISPFQQTFHLLVSPLVVLLLWQGEMMYKPRELCGVYNTQTRRWGQFLTSRRQGYTTRTIIRRKKKERVLLRLSKIFIWFFQPRRRCHSRFHSFLSFWLGICFVLLFEAWHFVVFYRGSCYMEPTRAVRWGFYILLGL